LLNVPRPKDETYIIDLCDEILKRKASRGHRFDFLRGDPGRRGMGVRLPVDAYYQDLNLVIEYCERQHAEAVPFFDRKIVPSGITRGEQRKLYDQRRRDVLPEHNITVLEISYQELEHDARKRLRRVPSDSAVIERHLYGVIKKGNPDKES
jgi:hypothetical protein